MLNGSLDADSVEIPTFVPLREISAMFDVEPRGHYCECPTCNKELRINRKYVGIEVQCKFCGSPFVFSLMDPRVKVKAHYFECPHCKRELRAAEKYMGTEVECKFCSGHIRFVERLAQDAS